jgi:hypothetical protein
MANTLEKIVVKSGFFLLKKAVLFVQNKDSDFQEDMSSFRDGFRIKLRVTDPFEDYYISFEKRDGKLFSVKDEKDVDLEIVFKGLKTAYRIFLTISTVHKSFVENKLLVYGDLAKAMTLIRMLNVVQSYLYPPFLSQRALKRPKKLNLSQEMTRLKLYIIGIPF